MHKYYKLEFGERWAKTGARFSPKDPLLLRRLQSIGEAAAPPRSAAMTVPSRFAYDIDKQQAHVSPVLGSLGGSEGDLVGSTYDSADMTSDLSEHTASPQEVYDAYSDTFGQSMPMGALGGAMKTEEGYGGVGAEQMRQHAHEVLHNYQQHHVLQQPRQEQQVPPPPLQEQQQWHHADDRPAHGSKRRRQHEEGEREGLVQASGVMITLHSDSRLPHMDKVFEVSLQTFLDTIDAGGHFISAQAARVAEQERRRTVSEEASTSPDTMPASNSPYSHASDDMPGVGVGVGGSGRTQYQARAESQYERVLSVNTMRGEEDMQLSLHELPESPALLSPGLWPLSAPLSAHNAGEWTQGSRGDQAYFFFRGPAQAPFSNGSVVALKDGQLVAASTAVDAELLLVVSDENALWKGEPHPTPAQEEEGHWCAFLGQVPLWVEGPVKAGEYLGPLGDGSGLAKVVTVGEEHAVGIALASKGPGLGAVKSMVSVGLNAVNAVAGKDGRAAAEARKAVEVVARLEAASVTVERAEKAAAAALRVASEAKAAAAAAAAAGDRAEVGVSQLRKRMEGVEEEVRDNRQMLDVLSTHPRRVLSRQYLWSCFCGLVSLRVTEPAPKGEEEHSLCLQPQKLDKSPGGPLEAEPSPCALAEAIVLPDDASLRCKVVIQVLRNSSEAVVTDTTINLALTCILMRVAHSGGFEFTLAGFLHSCIESAIHLLTLAYFALPLLAISLKFGRWCLLRTKVKLYGADEVGVCLCLHWVCGCVCVSLCLCVSVSVCIYWHARTQRTYARTHTRTHTHTHTHTHTCRWLRAWWTSNAT